MAYWWVYQTKSREKEIQENYVQAPDKGKYWLGENLRHLEPGDIVFSFSDASMKAIGIVKTESYSTAIQPEVNKNSERRVDVLFRELNHPIKISEIIYSIKLSTSA